MSEDKLQAQFFQYTWNTYPQLRRCMWAVPNGGYRNIQEAVKLKATGVIPGVWDIHVFYKGKFYIIETKVGRNTLSKDQIRWRDLMEAQGAVSFVYYSMEEGKRIIEEILK
ncbi:MAG: VRR-NUC domain-containing protein [Weeksellaceae bacterium]